MAVRWLGGTESGRKIRLAARLQWTNDHDPKKFQAFAEAANERAIANA